MTAPERPEQTAAEYIARHAEVCPRCPAYDPAFVRRLDELLYRVTGQLGARGVRSRVPVRRADVGDRAGAGDSAHPQHRALARRGHGLEAGVTASERPGPQITDEDVDRACIAATAKLAEGLPVAAFRAALETTLRRGGLVARAIADEYDRLAKAFSDDPHDEWSSVGIADTLRATAAEWREGKR